MVGGGWWMVDGGWWTSSSECVRRVRKPCAMGVQGGHQKVAALRRKLRCACCLFFTGLLLIVIIICSEPGAHYWKYQMSLQHEAYTPLREHHSLVHLIPVASDGILRSYPPFLKHHMTRYAKGCLDPIIRSLRNDSYQTILPWIHQFDHAYISCGIKFFAPREAANTTCLYRMPQNVTPVHRYHDSAVAAGARVLRVHVSNELPRYHDHFIDSAMPFYEQQWRNGTLRGILIHSGSGDTPVPELMAWRIVRSPAVVRWVVEQNTIDELIDHPKVIQLPTGLCAARAYGQEGTLLQQMMHRGSMKPWTERRNRVLFCFHTRYPHRHVYIHFAKYRCTVCDVCTSPPRPNGQKPPSHLQHTTTLSALWLAYTDYKYVFSPKGNGPDCGRTWEIMLMGAIPVMEHFAGAVGYQQGGLSTVIVRNESELSELSLQRWSDRFTSGNRPYRLRRLYWLKRVFGGSAVT